MPSCSGKSPAQTSNNFKVRGQKKKKAEELKELISSFFEKEKDIASQFGEQEQKRLKLEQEHEAKLQAAEKAREDEREQRQQAFLTQQFAFMTQMQNQMLQTMATIFQPSFGTTRAPPVIQPVPLHFTMPPTSALSSAAPSSSSLLQNSSSAFATPSPTSSFVPSNATPAPSFPTPNPSTPIMTQPDFDETLAENGESRDEATSNTSNIFMDAHNALHDTFQ